MKSRILILSAAVLMAAPAHAAWTDTQTAASISNAWSQVKTTVKVKVDGWIAYWYGKKTDSASVSTAAQGSATAAGTQSKPVPQINEAGKQLLQQPLYVNKTKNSTLKDVQGARDSVKAAQILKVTPGRVGTTALPKSKAGVPVSNFAKFKIKNIKRIPRLDIGTENLISRQDFMVPNLHWDVQQASDLQKLPQPQAVADSELRKWAPSQFPKAPGPNDKLGEFKKLAKPVTLEQVEAVNWKFFDLKDFQEMPYKPLSEDQMKMLAALILFNQGGHCNMVMGLFNSLASKEPTRLEATFHLGACAAELKMHQSAFDQLSKVIVTENPDYAPEALAILAKDLPVVYEKDFFKLVKGLKNVKALMTQASHDDVEYRFAKGAFRSGEYKTALAHAELVSNKAVFADDAQFLIGMTEFALGDKPAALKRLQNLWNSLEARKVGNTNIRALTTINLARMYFSLKKYDKALEKYMQVPKDHPLWVQALIEQGWTQIALEDYSGAIGNMYSLHSPYFKAVYQPESFVVRSIGYLNICQYGDAYKTLTFLEKDYRDWMTKESNYLSNRGNPANIYSTVKSYIRGKSTNDVDGVPYQVWREMAHRKDFLNAQEGLNDKIDESQRYLQVNQKLNDKRASIRAHADLSKKRFDDAKMKIARSKTDVNLQKGVDQFKNTQRLEREYTIGYRYQLSLIEQSRQAYQDFLRKAQARLQAETARWTGKAGDILLAHAKDMQKQMARVLDNNEFLRYEVFAGSGENIRYQVAGGQVNTSNRVPAYIKPQKMMNWDFDGEFWEDEIGSYRSSLQNNCPAGQRARAAKQAARQTDDDEN